MGINKNVAEVEVKCEEKDQVSQIIDRLYYHEFMMDEIQAATIEYAGKYTGYDFADFEYKEFENKLVGLKDVLNERLMRDLKKILHMC